MRVSPVVVVVGDVRGVRFGEVENAGFVVVVGCGGEGFAHIG